MVPSIHPPPPASVLNRYRSIPPDFMDPLRRYPDDEAAQELVWDAWDVQDLDEKFQLFQQALHRFPFSIDAYNGIADLYNQLWNDREKAIQCYRHALTCARILWPELEERETIEWGHLQFRPFLRAHHGLAVALKDSGQIRESVEHLRFLLRVNPSDNQGCRMILFQTLIDLGEYAEAEEAAAKHSDGRKSAECYFRYGFVLIDFLKSRLGVCTKEELESSLVEALQTNNFVPILLLRGEPLPERPSTMSPGGMHEAASYVNSAFASWNRVQGALDWLREQRFPEGCKKPNDDGTIFFNLLTKGKVVVSLQNDEPIEVTSRFSDMSGSSIESFKIPPGMKTHNPNKIVCFATGNEADTFQNSGFMSFPYSSVSEVPFWAVLESCIKFGKDDDEKHSCHQCFEPADLVCSQCQVIWYCSADCQREDWKRGQPPHKMMCKNYIKT